MRRRPSTSPDWVQSEALKSQITMHLIDFYSWVVRYGYRFTEAEAEKLREILEKGTETNPSESPGHPENC